MFISLIATQLSHLPYLLLCTIIISIIPSAECKKSFQLFHLLHSAMLLGCLAAISGFSAVDCLAVNSFFSSISSGLFARSIAAISLRCGGLYLVTGALYLNTQSHIDSVNFFFNEVVYDKIDI